MPAIDLQKDIVEKNLNTNNKLDPQEIQFLTSQKEGLKDLGDESVKLLVNDIAETNKTSFENDETTREILNAFISKPERLVNQLGIDTDTKKTIIGTFGALSSSPFLQQTYVLNLLLNYEQGKNINNLVKTNKKLYEFSPDMIRKIHEFQSKNKVNGQDRSEADCIVGRRTVQELCHATGITTGIEVVTVDKNFKKEGAKTSKEKQEILSQKITTLT